MVRIDVKAEVRPTEDSSRVREALGNLFPLIEFKEKGGFSKCRKQKICLLW